MAVSYVIVRRSGRRAVSRLSSAVQSLDVSVILPTYNEEGNVSRLIAALEQALRRYRFEIVIVDDDSKDRTPALIDRCARRGTVTAVHRYGTRGILSAIQDGALVARGHVLVIMDADFSHPPQMVPALVVATQDSDIASGSRFLRQGSLRAPFSRRISSRLFNGIIRFLMGPSVTDWTGGFHAMRSDAFRRIRFRYPAKWGEFDLELLYRAKRQGMRIRELPFVYSFREEGASKAAEGLRYFFGYALTYGLRALRLRLWSK